MKAIKLLLILAISIGFSFCKQGNEVSEKTKTNETVAINKSNESAKKILFFGNSLTAAYGIDPKDGYVALIQQKLQNEHLDYKAINAGLSGETSAGGLERIDWLIKQPIDIFVLELGGNDALRGIDPKSSYQNLKGIIEKVKQKYPSVKIVIAGMQAPPNMGKNYTEAFKSNYIKLSKEFNASLIPFLLENIGGIKELNIKDGIHPNEKGQIIMADNVWKVLKTVL